MTTVAELLLVLGSVCSYGLKLSVVNLGTLVPVGTSEVRLPLTCFCLRLVVEILSWYQYWYGLLVCCL
jgi:hypothetical protein